MRYEHFVKGVKPRTEEPTPNINSSTLKEWTEVLHKISEITAQPIPQSIAEGNTILNDYEADIVMQEILNLRAMFFSKIPLSKKMVKLFIYNIPLPIVDAIRWFRNHPGELPEIMNPAILLYPLLVDDPMQIIGLYLSIIRELIDDNREVIDQDANDYLTGGEEDYE